MWFIGVIVTTKVGISEGGLRVDNRFTRLSIPWSAVAETVVPLGLGGGSVLNALRGHRYQRWVRQRIEAARAASTEPANPADAVMTETWRPGVLRLALWAALYFGLMSPHLVTGARRVRERLSSSQVMDQRSAATETAGAASTSGVITACP